MTPGGPIDRAIDLLDRLEWGEEYSTAAGGEWLRDCPSCHAERSAGHEADCDLRRVRDDLRRLLTMRAVRPDGGAR